MYAARNNFAFDTIYWKKTDQRFFGATTCGDDDFSEAWRERLHLLDPSERELMEECVSLKIKERYHRLLAWDLDEYGIEWTERTRPIVQRERAGIKKEREEREAEEGNGCTEDAEGVNAQKEEFEEIYAKLQVSGAVEHCQENNWI
ncbi:Aminoglycoside phosphotransferase [Penicillium malachiteum]|nr:Aminoglycoside phosphotransferase [Penicillium malachiteum]